jgi:hypothetical protein
MGQSRADLMLNAGNYKAQIDTAKCEEANGDSKSNAPKYEMWTMNSSRSEGEPMIVKAWIPWDLDDDGEADDAMMYAKNEIYRAPSDAYPWGFFKMNFKLIQGQTSTSGSGLFSGYLRTKKKKDGSSRLQFYNPEPDSSGNIYQFSVTAKINSDGSGSAITTMPRYDQSGPTSTQKTYNVAFNSDYFYKQKSTVTSGTTTTADPVCLDRNKYLKSAWRYGMYYDNGSRVQINSGFPIKATNSSGTDYYGHIGYYGLWMPSDAGVVDNSTVAKMDFSGGANQSGTNYTVRKYGGKLVKYTKQTITLGSIKNIPLNWWDNSVGVEKRVFWNGDNLTTDGSRVSGVWVDNDSTIFGLNYTNAPYGFNFYSQALGGEGQIVLSYPNGLGQSPAVPLDNSTVIFNTQTPIFPGDYVPTTLACYQNCLNPSTIATGADYRGANPSIYVANKSTWLGWDNSANAWAQNGGEFDNASAPSAHIYRWDNSTNGMVLKYDNGTQTSVVLSSANNYLPWGARSGIMFDNSTFDNDTSARQADFASLKCSWDTTKICPWQARGGLSTFYVWETGPKSHNQLAVMIAGDNSSVKFDPPMSVKYTHSGTGSNSGKSYDNASFYLEYGGFGDLWGLPSFCISRKTGEKASCANDGTTRWVDEIMIPADSIATQTKDGSTHYMVKPLEIEQSMKKASSASVCTAAGLSVGGMSLPDSSGFSDPTDIGLKPTVSGPPAVVAGAKM